MTYKNIGSHIANGTIIRIQGGMNEKTLVAFLEQEATLLKLHRENPLQSCAVILNTRGGAVDIARTLHEELMILNTFIPVSVVAQTTVMSAGFYPLLSVPKDQRFSMPGTRFMLHPHTFHFKVELEGTHTMHEVPLREYEKNRLNSEQEMDRFKAQLAKGSGLAKTTVEKLVSEVTYFDADEAVKLGMVSGILEMNSMSQR